MVFFSVKKYLTYLPLLTYPSLPQLLGNPSVPLPLSIFPSKTNGTANPPSKNIFVASHNFNLKYKKFLYSLQKKVASDCYVTQTIFDKILKKAIQLLHSYINTTLSERVKIVFLKKLKKNIV